MGQGPQKGRLFPLKPMGKVVLKKRSMSSVSHIPVWKAHIVSDLKKIRCDPRRYLATTPPRLSGGYKRRSIAAISSFGHLGEVKSTSLHRNSRRSIFDSEVPIVNVEKRCSDCESAIVGCEIVEFRPEDIASAILLVACRVTGTRKFPFTVAEFAIPPSAPGVFQWKNC